MSTVGVIPVSLQIPRKTLSVSAHSELSLKIREAWSASALRAHGQCAEESQIFLSQANSQICLAILSQGPERTDLCLLMFATVVELSDIIFICILESSLNRERSDK